MNKRTAILKGCSRLQSALVEIQAILRWHQNWIASIFNKDNETIMVLNAENKGRITSDAMEI